MRPAGADAADGVRGRTLRDLGRVSAGKLISLGSLLLCNVLVARESAEVAEYGRYAAGLSLALILDAAIGTPLDISTVRFGALHPREIERTDRFQAAAFRVKVVLGIGLLVLAAFFGDAAAPALLGDGASADVLSVTLICMLTLLMLRSTSVRLQLAGRFTHYAALDAAQGLFRLLAVLGAILLEMRSADAFLAAYASGTALAFAVGLFLVRQRYLRISWPRRADIREGAVHVGFVAGIVILGTITGRADVPIVASFSAADAGQYAVALQVASVLTLLAGYGSVVMQQRVVEIARAGRFGALVRWNALGAAAITAAVIPFALWGAPLLIPAVFGAKYAAAGRLAGVLLAGTCADLFLMPVLMMFAIQMVPAVSLAGELLIAVGFFAGVFGGFAGTALAVAWLATGARFAKLVLYSCIALVHGRRGTVAGAVSGTAAAPLPD